jgi:Xaa-Pro dipeptidase
MSVKYSKLVEAEKKAQFLFEKIEELNLIQPGKTEKELNNEIFNLAENLFGIKKYWHKRIVRSGKNTLLPYQENPTVLTLQPNDILFFDFGPVFDEWEADFGRTFVIGEDRLMLKLKSDIESAWLEGKKFYDHNKEVLTGADFYKFTQELALKYGWKYGNEHCGHLVGNFPHEVLLGEDKINYIHPENLELMSSKDKFNEDRFWIYEIHFIDEEKQIGGFYEQLIS